MKKYNFKSWTPLGFGFEIYHLEFPQVEEAKELFWDRQVSYGTLGHSIWAEQVRKMGVERERLQLLEN